LIIRSSAENKMKIQAPYLTDKKLSAPYLRFVGARLHEMAQNELMAMISPAIIQEIKRDDPKPKFRAYVVGHEGESSGSISADNFTWIKVVKKWFKSAIRNLHDKIQIGTPLFWGHSEDNAAQREKIGEIVGKKLADIKDKLSVIVATYIKPEFATVPLNVASIEADIRLLQDGEDYAAEVDRVHAVALGMSGHEKPGFKDATLLTQLFEFAQDDKFKIRSHEMELTVDDVKKVIKAESIKPSDLFSNSDLSDDPSVKGFIDSAEKRTKAEFHDHDNRMKEKIAEVKAEAEKEKEDIVKQNTVLKKEVAKSKVDSLFETAKTARKLTEKQTLFIEKKLKKFEPDDPEKLEDEFSSFLDEGIKEFKSIAADVFGEKEEKEEPKTGDEGGNGDDEGSGTGDGKSSVDANPFVD